MALQRIVVDVESDAPNAPVVVLLHGFRGTINDLAPFARSLRVPGRFVVPEGPIDLAPLDLPGRAWWHIDVEARNGAIARGEPRDLSAWHPEGLDDAHALVTDLLDELAREKAGAPTVLAGFSQGGMLACDIAFRTERPLAAVAIFSSARIGGETWRAGMPKRSGMPFFMSHGRADRDLAFTAAERFKDDLVAAGLRVDFCPFDGGHEIPLVALRALKKFLKEL